MVGKTEEAQVQGADRPPDRPAGPFSRTARAELEKRRTADNLAGENVSRTLSLEQRVAWAGERGTSGADGGVIR